MIRGVFDEAEEEEGNYYTSEPPALRPLTKLPAGGQPTNGTYLAILHAKRLFASLCISH